MSAGLEPVRVTDAHDLSVRLRALGSAERAAILLSASVPYIREPTPDMTPKERDQARELSTGYVQSAQPQRIRLAVMELTKAALLRHAQLIFGAHPAISPMVLEAARNVGAESDSILIFQSDFFADRIPGSTLELADWSAGRLFFTPQRPAGRHYQARSLSLTEMRSLMVSPPKSARRRLRRWHGRRRGGSETVRVRSSEFAALCHRLHGFRSAESLRPWVIAERPARVCGFAQGPGRLDDQRLLLPRCAQNPGRHRNSNPGRSSPPIAFHSGDRGFLHEWMRQAATSQNLAFVYFAEARPQP